MLSFLKKVCVCCAIWMLFFPDLILGAWTFTKPFPDGIDLDDDIPVSCQGDGEGASTQLLVLLVKRTGKTDVPGMATYTPSGAGATTGPWGGSVSAPPPSGFGVCAATIELYKQGDEGDPSKVLTHRIVDFKEYP